MGVRLIVEVLDFAPANLTPRERWALVVLAEGARDTTRVCWPGVENDDRFIRRCRLSRSQRYAVIKALIEKGALQNVRRGQKHIRASYRIASMAPAGAVLPEPQDQPEQEEGTDSQGPGLQDAENTAPEPQGPDSQDAENTAPEPQGPGFGSSGSRFTSLSVPDYRTPSPQSPQSPQPSLAEQQNNEEKLFPDLDEEEPPKKTPSKGLTPAPDTFEITPKLRAWAKGTVPAVDIDFETEKFLDYFRGNGRKQKDWVATWRNWMRNAPKYAGQGSHLRVVNDQQPHHDPRYAKGTGSYVDPNAVYTEDPAVVFGTSS